MSHLIDRLNFFRATNVGMFADGHGVTTAESRDWEDAYRKRWQHDKIVRSTHGVNCTGSCSWKIYVKGGIVTWETQQTDYPRTRPDLPDHEPRGCSRGASYSWYLYSGGRLKYPLVRSRLLKLWRGARASLAPVAAWGSIVEDPEKRASYTARRGLGGFVRAHWDEVTEIIAAANAYTIKTWGPDRIFGFSPIPAMSMVSYAAGSRYLSLLGGVCMSFYDWYCDLPPSSPQTWGEQTDVPESADWYNSSFLILWGSNVPQTRTPDAHFFTEARYKGAKSVVICPDYSEASKFADVWLDVKQGTDAALAMAFGHVVLREFHLDREVEYFTDYCRRYTGHADAGAPRRAGRLPRAGPAASRLRPRGRGRRGQQPRVEAPRDRRRDRGGGGAAGVDRVPVGRAGQVEPRTPGRTGAGGGAAPVSHRRPRRGRGGRLPLFRQPRARPLRGHRPPERARAERSREAAAADRGRGAHRHRLRPPARELRPRPGTRWGACRGLLRCHGAVHPGLGGGDHRDRAGPDRVRRPGLRRQRGTDPWPLDGDHRGGDEPMVSHGHELPRGHQPAGDVRVRRPVGRGLVALRGAGEAQAPDRLASARLRPRLEPPAAADELHVHVVRAHRPVALRGPRRQGDPLSDRARGRLGRGAHRLQRAGGADGLAAVRPPVLGESPRRRPGRGGRGARGGRVRDGAASLGRASHGLRRPRRPGQLAAQPLRVALEPPRLVRKGPRVLPEAPPRHRARGHGPGPR